MGLQRKVTPNRPIYALPTWHIPGVGDVKVMTPTVFLQESVRQEGNVRYVVQKRFRLMWRGRPLVHRNGSAHSDGMFTREDMIFTGC